MDNSLFKKHLKLFNERDENKTKIIKHIKEKINFNLKEEEIKIEGKKVSFHLSSIKKSVLYKNNIKQILEEIDFKLI